MRIRVLWAVIAVGAAAALVGSGIAANPRTSTVVYDDFSGGNNAKWSMPYGPGEMAIGGPNHRESFAGGAENVRAVPFQTGYDFSVYDHLKYMEISNQAFPAHRFLLDFLPAQLILTTIFKFILS